MTQKAEQQYQNAYGSSENQNKWVWGILAGLAALGLVSWLALSGGPSTPVVTNPSPATEQIAPPAPTPPAAPAVDPLVPAQPAPAGTPNP